MKSATGYSLQFITTKIIGDFIYFPIWWYSHGLAATAKWWLASVKNAEHSLALIIWLKHLFKPMYAVRDIWGRVISFVMRLVILIVRLIVFVIALVWFTSLFLIYFICLPGAVLMLYFSAFAHFP